MAGPEALPEIPWDSEHPAFHVAPLETYQEVVRNHFDHSHVYYVGSHMKCGCGFPYDGFHPISGSGSYRGHRSLDALSDYLAANIRASQELQLFVTWAGDEGDAPNSFRSLSPLALRREGFSFLEGELVTIALNPARAQTNSA